MNTRLFFLLFAITLVGLFGCSHSTSPIISNTPQYSEGEFGFANNGTSIDSKNNPTGSTAQVSLFKNAGLGVDTTTTLVSIELNYISITGLFNLQTLNIGLGVPIHSKLPQTYAIGNWNDPTAATGFELLDSINYKSVAGGTLTITKFDTINNLLSGTFSFNAALAPPPNSTTTSVTVSSGFFNDIPITLGAGGQGTVTMNAAGFPFTTQSPGLDQITAMQFHGTTGLTILALDDDSLWQRELSIGILSPAAGNYVVSATPLGQNQVSMGYGTSPYNGTNSASISLTGSSGQLQITKYDLANRRISGSFNFSGVDQNSGNTIQITNGVIDNVQWSVQ
jgi:hypothetical protein